MLAARELDRAVKVPQEIEVWRQANILVPPLAETDKGVMLRHAEVRELYPGPAIV